MHILQAHDVFYICVITTYICMSRAYQMQDTLKIVPLYFIYTKLNLLMYDCIYNCNYNDQNFDMTFGDVALILMQPLVMFLSI